MAERISMTAFLPRALFLLTLAGFFFYHTMAAYEVIRPPLPLGGFWSYANTATALVLGGIALANREWRDWAHLPFALLCLIVLVNAVWHKFFGNEAQSLTFVLSENLKLLAGWAAFYLLGLYLKPSRQFLVVLVALLAAAIIITPFLVQTDPFSPLDADRRRFNTEVASYQYFANALAFMAVVAVAFIRSPIVSGLILAASWSAVFLIGSRSETAGMTFVTLLWAARLWLLHFRLSWRTAGTVAGAVGGVVLIAGGTALSLGANAVSRYADALDLARSESWAARVAYFSRGLSDIQASPLFGVYAGHMAGRPIDSLELQTLAFGHYVHNVLGMWAEHGIFAFVLFLGMGVSVCVTGVRQAIVQRRDEPIARLLLYVAFYTLALSLATKSIYWPMPAFAWGLAVAARREYQAA